MKRSFFVFVIVWNFSVKETSDIIGATKHATATADNEEHFLAQPLPGIEERLLPISNRRGHHVESLRTKRYSLRLTDGLIPEKYSSIVMDATIIARLYV